MRIRRENQTITLTVEPFERRVLHDVLRELVTAYQIKPGDIDPKTASVWYSTRGCQSAKMSAEDTAEWLHSLQATKSSVVRHLRRWATLLAIEQEDEKDDKQEAVHLVVILEEAPVLMTALNDYRLMTAARRGIGEAEMNLNLRELLATLSPERRKAFIEITLLGGIVDSLVHALDEPSPATGSAPVDSQ